jgi:hypothetical protein
MTMTKRNTEPARHSLDDERQMMSIRLSAKHRLFARLLASGEKPIVAYGAAGFVARRGNCTRLAKSKKIKAEVERLRGGYALDAEGELSPKQRAFARGLAMGLSPDVAYEMAGYARHRHNGQRLAVREAVEREVERLRREDQAVVAFANEADAALIMRARHAFGERQSGRDQGNNDSIATSIGQTDGISESGDAK